MYLALAKLTPSDTRSVRVSRPSCRLPRLRLRVLARVISVCGELRVPDPVALVAKMEPYFGFPGNPRGVFFSFFDRDM